jgi:hypothetical protein
MKETVSSNQPIKRCEARFVLKERISPVFHKAYDHLYAQKHILEFEINKLVNTGILKPFSHSQSAILVMLVPKKDGLYCMITNYKVTINPVIKLDHCPILWEKDIFNTFSVCEIFSVIYLATAYEHINLHVMLQIAQGQYS